MGEVAPLRGGYAFQSNQYANEGIPIVRISNILSDGSVGGEFVFHNELKDDEIFMLENGDIVLAMSGATTGKVSILSSEKSCKYYQNQRVGLFSKTATCNYSFVATIVRSEKFLEQLQDVLVAGAQPNVSAKDIDAFDFSVPKNVEEQSQIGNFFRTLDRLITLHQRKLDKMKELKKAFLNLIFSQKLRFYGFTESWELRKLPEFVNFYSGLTYTPDNVQESGTLVLRSSNVKNGEIIDADNVYVNIDIVNSENVQDGDIIVVIRNGSRALIGKHAQIKGFRSNTVIGAFMTGIRSEHPAFVNALLDTPAFEIEIAKNLGATINQITGYMFSKMEFAIPSSKEQIEIGKFFLNLDNLITLHQKKIDSSKEMKKILLKNMLI